MNKQSTYHKAIRGIAIFITLLIIFSLNDKYGTGWSNATRYIVWAVIAAGSVAVVVLAVDYFFDRQPKNKLERHK